MTAIGSLVTIFLKSAIKLSARSISIKDWCAYVIFYGQLEMNWWNISAIYSEMPHKLMARLISTESASSSSKILWPPRLARNRASLKMNSQISWTYLGFSRSALREWISILLSGLSSLTFARTMTSENNQMRNGGTLMRNDLFWSLKRSRLSSYKSDCASLKKGWSLSSRTTGTLWGRRSSA